MSDRVQIGARGSPIHTIEYGEGFGQFSDGWVVPADSPTRSAQASNKIDETTLNAFAASWSSSSLTVTIDAGEAFDNGWLATDVSHDVDLASGTTGQTVYVGWDVSAVYSDTEHADRDDADQVIVGLESAFDSLDPKTPLWTFDTDSSGVTSTTDERNQDDYRVSNGSVQGLRNLGNAALNDYPLLNTDLSNSSLSVAGNSVSLGGSISIDHGDLSSIGTSDHHSRYTDSEASSAAPIQSVNGSTGSIKVVTASGYSAESKSENTVYQNTSDYAIKIAVRMDAVSGGAGFDGAIYTDASSSSLESSSNQIDYTVESPYFLQGIIPSGNYYEVWGDSLTAASWLESSLS